MGVWTTSSTGNWSVMGSTGSTASTDIIWAPTITGGGLPLTITGGTTYIGFDKSLNDLKRVANNIREEIEKLAEKSPNFTPSLEGLCALASRKIHKELKAIKVKAKLAYLNNSCYQHVFIIVPGQDSSLASKKNRVTFKEDYIIDVTASLYGELDVCVIDSKLHDPVAQPWWSYEQAYDSESGLISRQKKDKWPVCQITFQAAKSKQTKLEFVMVGKTDVERGLIRIKPFDVGAIKYFKQQGKGEGLKSNLASLILDSDKQIADAALVIAAELLRR